MARALQTVALLLIFGLAVTGWIILAAVFSLPLWYTAPSPPPEIAQVCHDFPPEPALRIVPPDDFEAEIETRQLDLACLLVCGRELADPVLRRAL